MTTAVLSRTPSDAEPRRPAAPVLAAIDDDNGAGPVLAYALGRAAALGAPLRLVHVCTGHPKCGGRDHAEMSDADHLMSGCLAQCVPPDEAVPVERQILHDADPVRALIALSRQARLLVVASASDPHAPDGQLGSTALRLAGHAHCPVAIVPAAPVTGGQW
jgi:universal stress protein family protein